MTEKITIQTASATDTEQLGEDIGRKLRGGEVIELISDLGGGKTTFVRGLAIGAGSTDHVASPTFTVSKVYIAPKFDIHHFDFYRLAEAGLMEYELHDLLADPKIVVVVEWGGVVQHVLPDKRLTIEINQTENDARDFYMTCDPSLGYLLDDGANK
jgi:tRNA threonylcarbamoyladenosine biosynthesis protein TsaE